LKGVVTAEDWEDFKPNIYFDWQKDTHFIELQETEIMRSRVEMLRDMEEFKGEYFSKEWLRKNVLRQSDEDITMIDKQINSEAPAEGEEEAEEEPAQ
jgi:chromatin segregation and condensation protein Rec8/ScpA/Scc1 (kleisin family)